MRGCDFYVLMWVGAQYERCTHDKDSQLRSRNDNLGIRDTLHLTEGMVQSRETEVRGREGEGTVLYRYARTLILDV